MRISPVPIQPHAANPGGRPAPTAEAGPSGAAAQPSSLWEILTPEERAFFTQQASLGPLGYRPGGQVSRPAAPTGQRLDVRA
jgi:hypothetical protein